MARVLRPGGRVAVATNGAGHLRELWRLLAELGIEVGTPWHLSFPLEAAPGLLTAVFDRVEVHPFDNALRIADADPVVGYVESLTALTDQQAQRLRAAVTARITAAGAFHVDTVSGLLLGWTP
jgi:hypothetical protein